MAGFYKIFGTSIYVERFYDFLMLLISTWLIHKNWQFFVKHYHDFSFVAIFFWITIPVCAWAYTNNMLEITVSTFALASTYFLFKYYFKQANTINLFIAGFFIIAAGLSKGFVGLFPLSIPFFYHLIMKRFLFKKWIFESFLISIFPITIVGIIFLFENSRIGFTTYLTERVFNSIYSVSTVSSRFHIIGRLGSELLAMLIFNLLIISFYKLLKRKGYPIHNDRNFWFMLLIGMSASFPLMITKEQRGFYIVNSLPYYTMAFTYLFMPQWQAVFTQFSKKNWVAKYGYTASIIFMAGILFFSFLQKGKYSRDEGIIKDIEKIIPYVKIEKIISTNPELWEHWNLHSYFMRKGHISLSKQSGYNYYLQPKQQTVNDSNYEKINLSTKVFDVYKKKK